MDYVIKEALQQLTVKRVCKIRDLITQLEQNTSLPSFQSSELLERLLKTPGIMIEDEIISYEKQFTRLSLYIEDKSEDKKYLKVIDEIYQLILKEKEGLSYQQIQKKLSKNLELNQISHYCRKLFELNFVIISCKSHYKQVKARKFCDKLKWNGFEKRDEETSFTTPNYYREFSFYSNLWLNLQEPLLECEIRSRMNKYSESKSFSRMIDNLFKVEKAVNQIAERKGKIFMYRYVAKNQIKKWPYVNVNQEIKIRGTNVIEFREDVLQDLQRLLKQQGKDVEQSHYKIGDCLNNILIGNNGGKRKIQVSQQKINRFACICNYISENKIANVKELKDQICESEKDDGIIDTRTIHSLLRILEKIEFLNIHIVKTIIVQKECERWLVSHRTIEENDKDLQLGLLKLRDVHFEKPIKFNDEGMKTRRQLQKRNNIKDEEPEIIKKPCSSEQKQLNYQSDNQDHVFQSDDDQSFVNKINAKDHYIKEFLRKMERITSKIQKEFLQESLKKMKPNYDVRIANETFQRIGQDTTINLLLGLEQKVKRQTKCEFDHQSEDWEKETKELNPLQNLEFQELQEEATPAEQKNNKQFKKENVNYESQRNAAEKLKNYLLRYPMQSISKLMHIFPNVNIYILLKKMILDNTIEVFQFVIQININTNTKYNLDEALQLYKLENIRYKINENYLGYF